MFIVILALGTTDLLFALDSIPAIYGLTQEPFLVLTANIFALMGLRQLYFLIGGLLKRLVYLGIGLAILLAFIGVKLILHAMHVNELPFINGGEPIPGRRTSASSSRSASSSASWPSRPSPAWSRPARTTGPRSAAEPGQPAAGHPGLTSEGAGERSRVPSTRALAAMTQARPTSCGRVRR